MVIEYILKFEIKVKNYFTLFISYKSNILV